MPARAGRYCRHGQAQRGVAIITALLLTTLAVTAVTSLFWMQQVQVRGMENQRQRVQTQWIWQANLDSAQLILRQDGASRPAYTTFDGAWNAPMADIRLDHYVEHELAADERSQAHIGSRMIDAQSRYNVSNLATLRTPDPAEIRVFERLLANLHLNPGLALPTALAIAATRQAEAGATGADRPALKRMDELLGIAGYTPQIVLLLSEYAVLLPHPTAVNVNTAAPEVLAAAINLSMPEGRQLAARRQHAYFRTMDEFNAALRGQRLPDALRIDIRSDYFLLQSAVRVGRSALDATALIHRQRSAAPTTSVVWTHQD
ncbi:type II secretion system minor pseudopilin GspK [Janthinobacterium sp. LB3P118]|uniref:type II secretion system minor pseudopilin GspK n=1 Tax=Janthinobacterium sp. LB3P118 TaxID=3424195 RepID=UPI003F2081DB